MGFSQPQIAKVTLEIYGVVGQFSLQKVSSKNSCILPSWYIVMTKNVQTHFKSPPEPLPQHHLESRESRRHELNTHPNKHCPQYVLLCGCPAVRSLSCFNVNHYVRCFRLGLPGEMAETGMQRGTALSNMAPGGLNGAWLGRGRGWSAVQCQKSHSWANRKLSSREALENSSNLRLSGAADAKATFVQLQLKRCHSHC